jgi:hypothetical protein
VSEAGGTGVNANDSAAQEIFDFLLSELKRERPLIAGNVPILERSCTQASYVEEQGRRPIFALWMRTHWSFTVISGKRSMSSISEIISEYTEHIRGVELRPLVVVGRVNCYKRRNAA